MPEISQEELDDLRAKAAKADAPEPEPEHESERERVKGVDAKPGFDDDEPPANDQTAMLENGQTHDFSGAVPSHVAVGDRTYRVVGSYAL